MKKPYSICTFLLPLLVLFGFSYHNTVTLDQVNIGTQVWMKDNLSVCYFRNGDSIPQAKTEQEWRKAGRQGKPVWCYYSNDTLNMGNYGRLYNWYAVNDPRGLAPEGWHIPTDQEWSTLATSLGGKEVAGNKLKDTLGWNQYDAGGWAVPCKGCSQWTKTRKDLKVCNRCHGSGVMGATPSVMRAGVGTNESKFNGKAGGMRDHSGRFAGMYDQGCFWTTTTVAPYDATMAKVRILTSSSPGIDVDSYKYDCGLSVRCVKDTP